MRRRELYFRNRFPGSRDSWKFVGREPLCSWSCDELSITGTAVEQCVDVPEEVIEYIYELGWGDAISAAKEALSDEK
jgi:hypothetical protein